MAELHGFARPMDVIAEFDGSDENVRQLTVVDERERAKGRCCTEAETEIC